MYAAREAIATSSGQNDSGLFELNFRDERYLPFEFHGAMHDRHDHALQVSCLATEEWPGLYCGLFDTHAGPREDQASVRMSDSSSPQRSAKWNAFFCYAATSDRHRRDVTTPGNHRKTLANLP